MYIHFIKHDIEMKHGADSDGKKLYGILINDRAFYKVFLRKKADLCPARPVILRLRSESKDLPAPPRLRSG